MQWGGVDWIGLAQDMQRWGGGSCECGNEPSNSTRNYRVAKQLVSFRVVLSSIELVCYTTALPTPLSPITKLHLPEIQK
jgi:hypothetical protein